MVSSFTQAPLLSIVVGVKWVKVASPDPVWGLAYGTKTLIYENIYKSEKHDPVLY
jgi:hypothetical protein